MKIRNTSVINDLILPGSILLTFNYKKGDESKLSKQELRITVSFWRYMFFIFKQWLILFLVCAVSVFYSSDSLAQGKTGPNEKYETVISAGTVFDYTYQLLNIWKITDEKGIERIQRLKPPRKVNYKTDVEWFNAIRLWLRERSGHGNDVFKLSCYPPYMIERFRGNDNFTATCGSFSIAYAGILLSMDVPVRLVHIYALSKNKNLNSHTFTEVWSDDYQKWVVQDVDLNICWINNKGILMNAKEVQEELISGKKFSDWLIKPRKDIRGKSFYSFKHQDLFYRLVIAFQSNYFHSGKKPYIHHQKGSIYHLLRTGENEANDKAWIALKKYLSIKTEKHYRLLYAPINQIEIKVFEQKDSQVFLLKNNILNFDHYEISCGSDKWRPLKGDRLVHSKKDMRNGKTILIHGVSKRKHYSNPATIRFMEHS